MFIFLKLIFHDFIKKKQFRENEKNIAAKKQADFCKILQNKIDLIL